MAQRESGYARVAADLYETPAWVIDALAEHVSLDGKGIWEPACGTGQMAKAIKAAGAAYAHASDIIDHGFSHDTFDFLQEGPCPFLVHYDGIITNPPYGPRCTKAVAFCESGLKRIRDYGFLALLLPVDFDSAKTRAHLFRDCREFAGKIVLTQRIKWFEPPPGEKKAGPSENHAWYLWQRTWIGERQTPRIMYAPSEVAA